jgi:diaminopimelate epimerase
LLSIETSHDPAHAFAYGIWNRDGSPSGQCGNGVRCVAAWLAREGALDAAEVSLMSPSGPVRVACLADGRVRVNMGEPDFSPATIPLAVDGEADTYRTRIDDGTITFAAVSMGNPHAVIAVDGIAQARRDTDRRTAFLGGDLSAGLQRRLCRATLANFAGLARMGTRRGRNPGLRHRSLCGDGGAAQARCG